MILIEGLVACFLLLITCVVGIANGPVSLVSLYGFKSSQRSKEPQCHPSFLGNFSACHSFSHAHLSV